MRGSDLPPSMFWRQVILVIISIGTGVTLAFAIRATVLGLHVLFG